MDALRIEGIRKSFRSTHAVNGLDARIPRGSVCGLLGPNGAGKTTSIRMTMDIIRPDAGKILLFDDKSPGEAKERIGYMPEERGLYAKMTVRRFLSYIGAIKGIPGSTVRKRVPEWLERVGLQDWAGHKVEELSRGMQQKVQFICAVLNDPELLILDEPFSGLDPINADVLKDIILDINGKGKTIIFSTHVMEQAEQLCDYILLINKGKNVLSGTLGEIKAQFPSDTVLVQLEGESEWIKGLPEVRAVEGSSNSLVIKLNSGADEQALLRALVGRVRVLKFALTTPSLHEIFVQRVESSHE
jgi:ABC-2 type transport system ATP-binding protein